MIWKVNFVSESSAVLVIPLCAVEGSFKKKCLKDSTVPEYPNNVYYCNEESKSVCCVEDMQYTCCEPKDSIMMYVYIFVSLSLLQRLTCYKSIRYYGYIVKRPKASWTIVILILHYLFLRSTIFCLEITSQKLF